MTISLSRRGFLKTGSILSGAAFLGGYSPSVFANAAGKSKLLNFKALPAATTDSVRIAEGYNAEVLISFGDKLFPDAPSFKDDRSNKGADYAKMFGENNDGMEFFEINRAGGVLAVNNEYPNHNTLFPHKEDLPKTADEVLKSQNVVGLSLLGLKADGTNKMRFDVNSPFNRRVTAHTPMLVSGPAKGHDLLKTKADPHGKHVLGTFGNCSSGKTPWNTYVTCEENFDDMFGASNAAVINKDMKRYGVQAESGYGWEKFDDRFDLTKNPNEINRFGWVVEIDPLNPNSTPVKRTALGRFKHENVALQVAKNGKVVAYMGDDERGERIYKFVSKNAYKKGDSAHNKDLLDEGTLYVAIFDGGKEPLKGTGRWVALEHGKNGLTKANGFASQADIAIHTRQAADLVGGTQMDRPEWIAVNPLNGMVFCTLTNNSKRGDTFAPNAANPRSDNIYGHIIRWRETGDDHTAETFEWDMYVMAGNPNVYPKGDPRSGSDNITAENSFNSPDGIGFDSSGRIWIQTDGKYSNDGDFAGQGHNSMLCGDPITGEIRRFLTGPKSCEITGIAWAHNERTMFVNVQHPGEKNDSTFPHKGHTPRSSVIMISKKDGRKIGA